MDVRIIGCMRDLNTGAIENFVDFDTLIANLDTPNNTDFIDVSVFIDGASPSIEGLGNAENRNGYKSKNMSYNRNFKMTTRELSNFNIYDVELMQKLDYLHTFPYHYFSFWKIVDGNFVCTHKSVLGSSYYTTSPGFIVATFDPPDIKNNYADKDSKTPANRQYSWNITEYGIRSLKDVIGD